MSSENEIKKSNIDEKQSLFGKIRSKYVQKLIYNFIEKHGSPEFADKLLKYNKGLSPLWWEIKSEFRINQLSDFRNWYYYLKDIYSALNEVAKKIYNDEYKKLQKLDQNKLDEYKKYAIEAVIYICFFEIVYLTEKKEIFNAKDLQIQKAKIENPKNKQEVSLKMAEVSLKTTIFNIIQKAINESLNSENCDLKSSVDTIFCELCCGTHIDDEHVTDAVYNVIKDHLSEKFPKYREDDKLKNDFCRLIIKIIWLKNNNFYLDSIKVYNNEPDDFKRFNSKNFNCQILSKLGLPNFNSVDQVINEYDFDYQTLIESLQRNDNLYSIVCNNCDFDIRAYFSEELKVAIENALTTEAQKNKFKTFLASKNETNKDTKKEEPIPSCEKEDSKCI